MSLLGPVVAAFLVALEAFEPASASPAQCAAVAAELAQIERRCRLAKARVALRAGAAHGAGAGAGAGADGGGDDGGAGAGGGNAGAARWLAELSGSSVGAARADLDTVAALDRCPLTEAALAAGDLSLDQARHVAAAAVAEPEAEADLLALARSLPLGRLAEEARWRRHRAGSVDDLHARQWKARRLRWWTNPLGNLALAGELPPEAGVVLVNRLNAEVDRLWRRARRAARDEEGEPPEPRAAYAADALVALTQAGGQSRGRRADLVVVCDLRAWRRGRAAPEEPCHVVGGGPVPVDVARAMASDAFVKAVTHDGVRIHSVVHWGRHLSAELRTALELGTPPGFAGVACVEDGCGARLGLEWDHVQPLAAAGPTTYENLVPRCWGHHRDKTERDRAAGLLGAAPQAPAPDGPGGPSP